MLQTEFLGKIKTHFMFNNFFPKNVPFMRYVEKYVKVGQAIDKKYNTAHSHCMLNN
jgi:hypothetical protein